MCIAACDGGCPAGLACLSLPTGAAGASPGWVRGCLPVGAQRGTGASCRNEYDVLDDSLCASGLCLDLGALGVCSAGCDDTHPCPLEASCALLRDGTRRCLALCDLNLGCGDPLLACAPSSNAGAGAGPDGGAAPALCLPKICASDSDCGSAGRRGPTAQCTRGL